MIKAIDDSDAMHFVLVLRDVNDSKFRAVYAFHLTVDEGMPGCEGCEGEHEGVRGGTRGYEGIQIPNSVTCTLFI